jgi:hypothetical protein
MVIGCGLHTPAVGVGLIVVGEGAGILAGVIAGLDEEQPEKSSKAPSIRMNWNKRIGWE